MNSPIQSSKLDPDDIGHNDSANNEFDSVLTARLSRRSVLRGGVGGAAAMLFGGLGVIGLSQKPGWAADSTAIAASQVGKFNFNAVAKSLADVVSVPKGYTASVLYSMGDPLFSSASEFKNDGTDAEFDQRAGEHHDGMEYFGLSEDGKRDQQSSLRAILGVNHEHVTQVFLHANGGTNNAKGAGPRPAAEVNKEMAAHGVSFVEVRNQNGKFAYQKDSPFNRRLTAETPVLLAGPLKGSSLAKTKYSADGQKARGTLNNCATGATPWGTMLTCEENWASYFALADGEYAKRNANEVAAFKRYGIKEGAEGGADDLLRWSSVGPDERYARWNTTAVGANSTEDFRNEPNTFGYVVEIDPYDAKSTPKKRSNLGRFAHESAVCPTPVDGKPVVFYMGDDARNEYIYKFVSKAVWDSADANKGMEAGDKYLDEGTLYVAKFNEDGSGDWLPLTTTNPAIANYSNYRFADQADVIVNTRISADAAGATKMDRPEWCAVNPKNGEVYFTLTNNSKRTLETLNSANPRVYEDTKNGKQQVGNVNGHIIRTAELNKDPAAVQFRWDIYLFAAQADADASVNLSSLTDDNDMSSPDGIWFSKTGLLWIQTDDGAYTDVTNCMMLAAIPGQVGDGGMTQVTAKLGNDSKQISTQKGANPSSDSLRRFLVGPKGCEITGIAETPDSKAIFVNIQHPGEATEKSDIGDPSKWQSHWPAGGNSRARSATIVITKDDGGTIGV